jgi:antitoxin component of MazEF toxin-antitoxin module
MDLIDVIARKWGDSIAIILPREIVMAKKINPLDKIKISVEKEDNLSDLFGKFPRKLKKTAQKIKDELREGWE